MSSIFHWIIVGGVLWVLWLIFKPSPRKQQTPDSGDSVTVKVSFDSRSQTSQVDDRDRDAWEGSFWEAQDPFPVKAALRLKYEDGNGNRTERIVDVRQFDAGLNGGMLIGHCRLRDATRTFRVDRISQCIDTGTGQIVDDVSAYLRGIYEGSPEYARDQLIESEYDALRILLFLGKADGQLRAAEKAIIRETCCAMSKDSRITDSMIDELFAGLAVPTLQAFRLAVGRVIDKSPESRAALIGAAERMVATQKTVHPSEQEALDYLRARLDLSTSTESKGPG